jgi:predicted short-subunit dehydrogenase-like oxidoreductase (DUF2520 family)
MGKESQRKISIIGAGRVGITLGYWLARENLPFAGIFSRSEASSEKAMKFIKKGSLFSQLKSLIRSSHIILIAVNDEEIKNVVGDILKAGPCRGKIFMHTSGLLSSSVLSRLASRGAFIASLHPLLPIPAPKHRIKSVKGSYFALEGQEKAVREAKELIRRMGAQSFKIDSRLKSRYHLAACFLSNYIVALSDLALDILPDKPYRKNEWLALFSPLMEATARSLGREGIPDALTGPIARGDLPTLRKHKHELKKLPKDMQKLHRILSRRALKIALQQNNLPVEKKKKLLEVLISKVR